MTKTLEQFTAETKRIKEISGRYELISPYHKKKKMLPFNVLGCSFSSSYPVAVQTVEYKGWTCKKHIGNYKLEVIEDFILTGFIKKVA